MRPPRRERTLRMLAALAAAALVVLAVVGTAEARVAAEPVVDATLEHDVFVGINKLRRANGLSPLRRSPDLTTAARAHALSMGRLGFFSHDSADGTSPTRRIKAFYDASDTGLSVGEIIQWAAGEATADEALAGWLRSDHHRRELFRAQWREVGIGVVRVDDAPGVYGGQDVTILVVDFGRH